MPHHRRLPPPPRELQKLEARVQLYALNTTLAVLVAAGTFSTLWISDDFDPLRLACTAYVGIPVAALYSACEWLQPRWRQNWRRQRLAASALLVVIFSIACLPLLNAATATDAVVKRSFSEAPVVANKDYRRGGLGGLFRRRW
jgi:hypothetical protein